MYSFNQPRRWPAVLVLAALALGTIAPLAEADSRRGNDRGKRDGRDHRVESRSRDRDKRVESRWRDRGSRSDTRWRRDADYRAERWRGFRDRDVRVEKRVIRRDVRPVYRSRTVYRDVRPVYRSRTVYRTRYNHCSPYGSYTVWRRSNTGAVFAGFVGGLFLGATLANRAPAGFVYYDPYCHDTFTTLSAYYAHCAHHHHARTVHVIEIAAGYDYHDYHYCGECDVHYWGDDHDCD